jgi:hypothetical protein
VNENEDTVELTVPRFVKVPLQYTAYGQSVDVSGYETKITITNNSVEWLSDIKVVITNRYGTRVYTVTTTSDDRENKNSLGKNNLQCTGNKNYSRRKRKKILDNNSCARQGISPYNEFL